MNKKRLTLIGIIVLIMAFFFIFKLNNNIATDNESELPNPAAVYCTEQGYTLESRTNEDGTYSVCKFNDGTECGQWAYYNGECKPGEYSIWVLE